MDSSKRDLEIFIARGYHHILHREPDILGFEYYFDEISSGKMTRMEFLDLLRMSDEHRI